MVVSGLVEERSEIELDGGPLCVSVHCVISVPIGAAGI